MAGLPGSRAWVIVGPPLSASGPSRGSVLIRSVGLSGRAGVSENRLWPPEVKGPGPERVGPSGLERMLAVTISTPELSIARALSTIVELTTVNVAASVLPMPTPVLPLIVELTTVSVPMFRMPPGPWKLLELATIVERSMVIVPKLSTAPVKAPVLSRMRDRVIVIVADSAL